MFPPLLTLILVAANCVHRVFAKSTISRFASTAKCKFSQSCTFKMVLPTVRNKYVQLVVLVNYNYRSIIQSVNQSAGHCVSHSRTQRFSCSAMTLRMLFGFFLHSQKNLFRTCADARLVTAVGVKDVVSGHGFMCSNVSVLEAFSQF